MRRLLDWCASTLRGHFTVSLVAIALPFFILGWLTGQRTEHATAGLGTLLLLSVLLAIPPPLMWYFASTRRRRQRETSEK